MNFPAALDAALRDWYAVGGIKRPVTHLQGLKARMRALERHHGGKEKAARAIGVSPSAWRSWVTPTGKRIKPSAASLDKVATAYDRLIRDTAVDKANEQDGDPPTKVSIRAEVVFDPGGNRHTNRTAYRDFNADRLHAPTVRAVVETWHTDGPEAAAAQLAAAIAAAYPSSPGSKEVGFEGDDVVVMFS